MKELNSSTHFRHCATLKRVRHPKFENCWLNSMISSRNCIFDEDKSSHAKALFYFYLCGAKCRICTFFDWAVFLNCLFLVIRLKCLGGRLQFLNQLYKRKKREKLQSNSVITNSSGPAIFGPYNRVNCVQK